MSSRSNPSRPPGKPHGKLTAQQARFAEQYIVDLNGTQAAIRAGYSQAGAASQANALLHKPQVAARVQELQAARAHGAKIDARWVLERLICELTADTADLYGADGRLKPVREWPLPFRRGLITQVKTTELFERDATGANVQVGVTREVVFADRARRLELLGRHVDIAAFKDRVSIGVDDPLKTLFLQISGNVIRPASERAKVIEHQPATAQDSEGPLDER